MVAGLPYADDPRVSKEITYMDAGDGQQMDPIPRGQGKHSGQAMIPRCEQAGCLQSGQNKSGLDRFNGLRSLGERARKTPGRKE